MTVTEIDGPGLVVRTEALTRFVIGAEGVLPADRTDRARALAKRAGDRLQLSGEHTVVALVGATGSGKSSLFNALARMELSTVGVRRPTTAHAFACVWGPLGAAPLLDWLEIAPERRFSRESALDAEDEAGLRGLVLLDLPDFDSLAAEHRVEVDRLLTLVDLMVWVTDPQKYADQVIHDQYLRVFRRHGDVTVVVLNQADRLTPPDAERCVADLAGLIASDGLPEVPVFAVSAVAAGPGCGQLRRTLEGAVAARRAGLRRLAADLTELSAGLTDLVDGPVGPESIDRDQVALLADALAAAAGVPAARPLGAEPDLGSAAPGPRGRGTGRRPGRRPGTGPAGGRPCLRRADRGAPARAVGGGAHQRGRGRPRGAARAAARRGGGRREGCHDTVGLAAARAAALGRRAGRAGRGRVARDGGVAGYAAGRAHPAPRGRAGRVAGRHAAGAAAAGRRYPRRTGPRGSPAGYRGTHADQGVPGGAGA